MIETILVALIVLTSEDRPVKGAQVDVEGDKVAQHLVNGVLEYVEYHPFTDARGVYVADVVPGEHMVTITKAGYRSFSRRVLFVKGDASLVIWLVAGEEKGTKNERDKSK